MLGTTSLRAVILLVNMKLVTDGFVGYPPIAFTIQEDILSEVARSVGLRCSTLRSQPCLTFSCQGTTTLILTVAEDLRWESCIRKSDRSTAAGTLERSCVTAPPVFSNTTTVLRYRTLQFAPIGTNTLNSEYTGMHNDTRSALVPNLHVVSDAYGKHYICQSTLYITSPIISARHSITALPHCDCRLCFR